MVTGIFHQWHDLYHARPDLINLELLALDLILRGTAPSRIGLLLLRTAKTSRRLYAVLTSSAVVNQMLHAIIFHGFDVQFHS
jgi:hypothetical protein